MKSKTKTVTNETIQVLRLEMSQLHFCILGQSPLIYNAVSEKAKHELLYPGGRKSAVERAGNLKHQPLDEYRNSTYQFADDEQPSKPVTRLFVPGAMFKAAMATAALDIEGIKKTELERLLWVEPRKIPVFGVPQLLMSITRSSDINRTPDVRTRAILPEWACFVTVNFVRPKLNETCVGNVLASAGMICGIGDWRQQKGSGDYGRFEIVAKDNPAFVRLTKTTGREIQDRALAAPSAFDLETERLLNWFQDETKKRGQHLNGATPKVDSAGQVTAID